VGPPPYPRRPAPPSVRRRTHPSASGRAAVLLPPNAGGPRAEAGARGRQRGEGAGVREAARRMEKKKWDLESLASLAPAL
jgi:hypothetical protein